MTQYKVTIKEKGVPKPITTHYVGMLLKSSLLTFMACIKVMLNGIK